MDRFKLDNKYIIVTGAAGSLGYYHSLAILEKGGNPILLDINSIKLKKTTAELSKLFKKKILSKTIDITKLNLLNKFFQDLYREKIKVDCLINNADINNTFNKLNKSFRIEKLNISYWKKHIDLGLTANFILSSLYYTHLLKTNYTGSIINISSDLGIISPDNRLYERKGISAKDQNVKPVSYSCVKHGLIGLTKYFSTYNTKILRCNAVALGGLKANNENFEKKISKLIPLNRMANPEEYITTIQYLLSPNTSYLNGTTIIVDGGRTII